MDNNICSFARPAGIALDYQFLLDIIESQKLILGPHVLLHCYGNITAVLTPIDKSPTHQLCSAILYCALYACTDFRRP